MKITSLAFVAALAWSSASFAVGAAGGAMEDTPEAVTVVTTEIHHNQDGSVGVRHKSHHFGPKNHASNEVAEAVSLGLFDSAKDLLGKAGKKVKEVGGKAIEVGKKVGGKALEAGKTVGGAAINFVETHQDTIKDIASKGLELAVKEGAGLAGAALSGGKQGAKEHVMSRVGEVVRGGKKSNEE